MVSKAYLDYLKLNLVRKNGKIRIKKPVKWLFPLSAERGYTRALYEFTFQIRKVISRVLFPKIPLWLAGATITYPDPVIPKIKIDSIIDDIISDLNLSLELIYQLLLPAQTEAINQARLFGLEVAAFNRNQYSRVVNSALGIDIFLEEPWLVPQLELFANQNAQLITNMNVNEIEIVTGKRGHF